MSHTNKIDASVRLAKRVAETTYEDLNAEEIAAAKRGLMDGLACLLAGSKLAVKGHTFTELAIENGGTPQATVLGYNVKLPATEAAFANGALIHVLDYDDVFRKSGVHPSHGFLPALLAAAELKGNVSGKDLITAFAVGADVMYRISVAASPEGQRDYMMFGALCNGYFGAAAAAGKILGLNAEEMASCFGLVFTQLSGTTLLLAEQDSNMREVFPAFCNRAGVLSAILAQRGVKGTMNNLEAPAGFLTVCMRGNYHPETLEFETKGDYEVSKLCLKPYPSCGWTHIFIDLTCRLIKKYNLTADDVEKITVRAGQINYKLCTEDRKNPSIPMEAKFSVPYCLGVCFANGKAPGLADFTPEGIQNKKAREIAQKFEGIFDPKYNSDSIYEPAWVNVKCVDGREYSIEDTYAYGTVENPMTREDRIAKFVDCAASCRTPIKDIDKVVDMMENLETVPALDDILRMICG